MTCYKNESNTDRAIRIIMGIAILSLVAIGPQSTWGYLGLIPLLTGLIGLCPVYSLLGIKTCTIVNK